MRNRPCKMCQAVGHDRNGDHLFLSKDGTAWLCVKQEYHLSGKIYVETIDGKESHAYTNDDEDKWREEYASMKEVVQELQGYSSKYRGIRPEIYEAFGIKYSVDQGNGKPKALYFPITKAGKVTGYHIRDMDKKTFANTGDTKGAKELMFQSKVQTGGKKLLICEGAYDALSAYQILKDKYPQFTPSVVSTNNGIGSGLNDVRDNLEFINSFQEVLLCFDNDDAGDRLTKECAKLIGKKNRILSFTEKDANDMLSKNKVGAFISAFFSAKEYAPEFNISIRELTDEAVSKVEYGLSYPFNTLTNVLYGARLQEVTSIAGSPGSGKSLMVQQLVNHLMFKHSAKVAIFSLEESPVFTLKKFIGGVMRKPIHLPDCEYDKKLAKEISRTFEDKLYIYNHNGNYENWNSIVSAVRYYAALGVSYFVIDPLSALVAHLSASDGNEYLNHAAINMSALAQELGVSFYTVSHLNNSKSGAKDHSEGQKVRASEWSGSRGVWRYSNNMIGIERNQQAEEEDEKHLVTIRILKNRLSGNTPTFNLRYDPDTGLLKEVEDTDEGVIVDV